jgi:hypothetical protein
MITLTPSLTRRVAQFRVAGVRNGFLAARMDDVLRAAGCTAVEQERFEIALHDPDDAFGLPTWAAAMVDAGVWSAADGERFDDSLAAASAAGTFQLRIDLVLTHGRVAA